MAPMPCQKRRCDADAAHWIDYQNMQTFGPPCRDMEDQRDYHYMLWQVQRNGPIIKTWRPFGPPCRAQWRTRGITTGSWGAWAATRWAKFGVVLPQQRWTTSPWWLVDARPCGTLQRNISLISCSLDHQLLPSTPAARLSRAPSPRCDLACPR